MVDTYISHLLPDKYIKPHRLLLYYNDLIGNMLFDADEENLSTIEVNFKESISEYLDEDGNIIDWMMSNGYEKEARMVSARHTFFSLLTDFNFYMHESFSCSERGKVTVAYAISRKPLRENLLYFCWLLNDYEEFIDILINGEPKEMSISALTPERKLEILTKACENIDFYIDSKILYEYLYDRKSEISLMSIWDTSLHLITENKHYPTKHGNINFVFADDKIWDNFWSYYYDVVPHVMAFVTEIIFAIYTKIINATDYEISINKYFRMYQHEKVFPDFHQYGENFSIKIAVEEILDSLVLTCDNCEYKAILRNESSLKDELLNDFMYKCPNCGKLERVGEFAHFNEEEK